MSGKIDHRTLQNMNLLPPINQIVVWAVWPVKSCQLSIKVAQKWFKKKLKILTPLQKLPKDVQDLGKLIVAKGFENLPKVK